MDIMRNACATARARELLSPKAGDVEYPVEALGPLSAVARAIADGVQCDPALAGQSVLSAAALLIQSVANIRSLDGRPKPVSLYALTVAQSGEGKDSADGVAFCPIREWQRDAANAYRRVKARIRNEDTPPPEPYRVTSDITLEGLRRTFRDGVASQGGFSTEAATMLVGHALNRENRIKTAAALCGLWDGSGVSVARAGSGRFERYGTRLSMHLMVQPAAVSEVMTDEGLLHIGFWPRFLLAWPELLSPRKYCPFRPESSPAVMGFWQRCTELLHLPLQDDNDKLPVLDLDESAVAVLAPFLEERERRARGGDWQPIRPFALRAAELAVRIAGVQSAFAGKNEVDAEGAERGIVLVRHSLDNWLAALEGRRVESAIKHSTILYQWLLNHGKPIKPGDILRVGPGVLRSKARRDAALERLVEAGLVTVQDGKVVVAPLNAEFANPANGANNPADAELPGDANVCEGSEARGISQP